jgi:hypothetical protein
LKQNPSILVTTNSDKPNYANTSDTINATTAFGSNDMKIRRGVGTNIYVESDFGPPQIVTKQMDTSGGAHDRVIADKEKRKRLARLQQQEQGPQPYRVSDMTNYICSMAANLSLSSANLGLAADFAQRHEDLCINYDDYNYENSQRYKAKDRDVDRFLDEYKHVKALLARIEPVAQRYQAYDNNRATQQEE